MIRTHTLYIRWIEDQAISQHEKLDSPTFRGNTECCCRYLRLILESFCTWWTLRRWWCKCRHLRPPGSCSSCHGKTRCQWLSSSSCPCHRRCRCTLSAARSPSSSQSSSGKRRTWLIDDFSIFLLYSGLPTWCHTFRWFRPSWCAWPS